VKNRIKKSTLAGRREVGEYGRGVGNEPVNKSSGKERARRRSWSKGKGAAQEIVDGKWGVGVF